MEAKTLTKVIIPNKSWILEKDGIKLGTINRSKEGFEFYSRGKCIKINSQSTNEFQKQIGCELVAEPFKPVTTTMSIYGFPCNTAPVDPVYDVKLRLPVFSKSKQGQSLYCAGHYLIKFSKSWIKSFCPKLVTLQQYEYYGPFATADELTDKLLSLRTNETVKHTTD